MKVKYQCDSDIVEVSFFEPREQNSGFFICSFVKIDPLGFDEHVVHRAAGEDARHAMQEAIRTMAIILEGEYDQVILLEPKEYL